MQSSITIGEDATFELHDSLDVRLCSNDIDYPLSLEGITKGGHDVAISVNYVDTYQLYLKLEEMYG